MARRVQHLQRRAADLDAPAVGEVEVPEVVGVGELPERLVVGVQHDRRDRPASRSAGATRHVVVVGVGADDRLDLAVRRRRPGCRRRVCGASITTHSLVVADHPDVVVDVEGLAVERERAAGDGVVDPQRRSHQRITTERSTSPSVHLVERRLDVADADLLGDERVEVEPALLVEVDEHREVAVGQAVAVPAGLERAAATEDVDQREVGDLHVRRRYADQDDGAGQVAGVERLLPGLRAADRLDHDVGAVAAGRGSWIA